MQAAIRQSVKPESFVRIYGEAFKGDAKWQNLNVPTGDLYAWQPDSTYVKHPPYFEDMPKVPGPLGDIKNARVLALLGDSITTDHISPAGSIKVDGPAGEYLIAHGVAPSDFNSYGSRRGNHEVMIRGTFANVRLKNKLAPGTEGGFTRHLPDGAATTIFDASVQYIADGVPLLILAGKEYGSGSSRDWAAKGPRLLGVHAVIAESYERIHRSNLVGMGVLPLEFQSGETAEVLGLTGEEVYEIAGIPRRTPQASARARRCISVRFAPTATRSTSRPFRASTRRRNCSTTSMAASCSTCCGSYWVSRNSVMGISQARLGIPGKCVTDAALFALDDSRCLSSIGFPNERVQLRRLSIHR